MPSSQLSWDWAKVSQSLLCRSTAGYRSQMRAETPPASGRARTIGEREELAHVTES